MKMKIKMILMFFFSLVLQTQLVNANPFPHAAPPGGQEGHGGDIAVSMFLGIAHTTYDCFKATPDSWSAYPLLLGEFSVMLEKAQVYSVEKTILNGQEVDAINYPDLENPKILINRSRWLSETIQDDLRAELIFHEYLSLIGYDDSRYQISYPIIQNNKNCINKK